MDIPTIKTQMKIAELLHDLDGCQSSPFEECSRRDDYVTESAFFLGKLIPSIITEMFPAVRADEREKLAYYIRAELVCCDIHERLEAEAAKGHWDDVKHQYVMPESWEKLRRSRDYHAICHYGGWAAQLAQEGPEWDRRGTRMPCVANGGTEPCRPIYFCPVSGENESPCHGGFDNCCAHPDLHGPAK